jgi:prefoldin subunit 5
MPITGAETNELLADKPKTKEEKKMERIQKKIDKLEKKQNKFNEKLAELNKNEAQTETEIVTKTRDNMNIVT